jgi:hypothetical protein
MNDQVELIPSEGGSSEDSLGSQDLVVPEELEVGEPAWQDQYFWITSYPGFETTLFLAPDSLPSDQLSDYESMDCSANLTFFDCDGGVVNEVSLAFPGSRATSVELGQFMASAKLHCGWKSSLLKVSVPSVVRPYCRLQASSRATFLGVPQEVTDNHSAFFPVTIAPDRSSLLVALNPPSALKEPATLKCRFYRGTRTPEMTLEIPSGGFRILGIESEFAEYCEFDSEQEGIGAISGQMQSYLRLSLRGEQRVMVQTLEVIESDDQTRIISSVG